MAGAELRSFLPARLVEHLATHGAPAHAIEHRRDAAVLIADVVGFSILAETLGQTIGNAGPEELARRIDACLAPVVDGILAHGGDVVGFAGDAVIAAWPGGGAEGDGLAHAAACALALPGAVPVPDGEPLRLRIGVATGEVVESIVGGERGQWLQMVRGDVFAELRGVLADTAPGEIRVGTRARTTPSWATITTLAEAGPGDTCSVRLLSTGAPVGRAPRAPALPAPAASPAALTMFLAAPLVDRLEGGSAGWIAEMRRTTVAFVGLDSLSAGGASLAQVQQTALAVQAAVHSTDGAVLQVAVDEKGAMVLAAWGLPGSTHEDDAARGALAALRLRESLAALGVDARVGVATGRVFCGLRGSSLRREYGVLGAVVNLSARLMGAAGADGVLCDEITVREAGGRVEFGEARTRVVKGREAPVSARTPLAGRARPARAVHALIGRQPERDAFAGLLEGVRAGRGGTLVLLGDAGMGKSALLRQLADTAADRGARWVAGWGDALETTTSYFALRPILAALLGDSEVAAQLAALGLDPALAPLLSPMLRESLPDTPTTRSLVGAARAESTARLFVELCGAVGRGAPLVLAIDDAHWLDSASWLVLQRICIDAPPLALVVATRPTEAEPLRAMEPAARVQPLAPMEASDLRTVLAARLGAPDVDDGLLAAVDARAQGNPFYAEEIVLALREGGHVSSGGGVARLLGSQDALQGLPTSLEGIVTSRIDRLPAAVQTTLKAASIAGGSFQIALLAAVHPTLPDRDTLALHLDQLREADLAVVDPAEPGAWRFRHRVVQEAAYGLLLLAQRKTLHRAVALELERLHASALAPYFGVLAEHWTRAGDTERAVTALERAADQAHAAWANAEAVGFYERALTLGGDSVAADRKGGWLRRLGDARLQLGDLAACRARSEEALAVLGHPLPSSAAARAWRLFTAAVAQARYQLRQLRAFPEPAEAATVREAALAHGLVSTTGFWKGDVWALVYGTVAGANLTERLPPSGTRAIGYAGLSLVCGALPLHTLAERYGRRAIAVATASGDPDAIGYADMMFSIYLFGVARFADGYEHARAAIALHRRIGYGRRVEECLTVLFSYEFMIHGGDRTDVTQAYADEMLASARRRNDTQSASSGKVMLAVIAAHAGDLDRAWSLWQDARYPDSDRLNQLWGHGRKAELALLRRDLERARVEARAALAALTASTTLTPNVVEAVMHAGRVLARLDERRDARAYVTVMRRYARIYPAWGPAVLLVEAELARASGGASAALFARARSEAEKLGVTVVTRLLPPAE